MTNSTGGGSKLLHFGRALAWVFSGRRRSALRWLARVVPLGVLTGASEALDRLDFDTDRGSTGDARCCSSSGVSTIVCRAKVRGRVVYAPVSGAPEDLLGRARGDGWDAAGGPVPRAETRVTCLFKHLSLTRGEHVVWEDPRREGPASSPLARPPTAPQAPPLASHEVSAHPQGWRSKRETRVTDGDTWVLEEAPQQHLFQA